MPFPCGQQSKNIKIFNKNFQWEFSMKFFFCELSKGVHNTFMVKVECFTVCFKVMPFWVTSRLFKKLLYDMALTCSCGMSIVIVWWCFCDTWLLYSDKLYWIRRVRWCSYAANCAWYNNIVSRVFVAIQ